LNGRCWRRLAIYSNDTSQDGAEGRRLGENAVQLAECRAECSIEHCALNLKQKIGASSGSSHPQQFVHSPIDEKVGSALGDRSSDTQAGTMPCGDVDEPTACASDYVIPPLLRYPRIAEQVAALAVTCKIKELCGIELAAISVVGRQPRRS
jgi:hypothetical protein